MKAFTVRVRFANGATDFFQSCSLEAATRMLRKWRDDVKSVYVSIA